ncbi:MAG: hypothetical protein WAR57_03290 [Candidatus Phosphoribacter sp.]
MTEPRWFEQDANPDPTMDDTGVRSLLAALPDPGPMPEAVAASILSALAAAQDRGALEPHEGSAQLGAELGLVSDSVDQAAIGDDAAGNHTAYVVGMPVRDDGAGAGEAALRALPDGSGRPGRPPEAPRRLWRGRQQRPLDRSEIRRRRQVVLGSAAASLAVIALAAGGLSQLSSQSGTTTAGVLTANEPAPAAGSPGASDASELSRQPDGAKAPTGALPNGASAHIEQSARSYTAATLPRLAQAMLDTPGAPPPSDAVSLAEVSTLPGLSECLTTLGEGSPQAVFVDLADFDGQPAAVIVVVDATGLTQAYAVQRSCAKGEPGLLAGPVVMP